MPRLFASYPQLCVSVCVFSYVLLVLTAPLLLLLLVATTSIHFFHFFFAVVDVVFLQSLRYTMLTLLLLL